MKLQSVAIDVVQAYMMVESVVKDIRQESESEFHKQFTEATTLGKKLYGDDFELSRPRVTGRQVTVTIHQHQVQRANYRITLYDEFLRGKPGLSTIQLSQTSNRSSALSTYQVC